MSTDTVREPRPSTDEENAPLLEQDEEEEQQWFTKRLSSREIVLLAVSFGLLCLASIGFGLFAGQKSNNRNGRGGLPVHTVTTTKHVDHYPSQTSSKLPKPTQPSRNDGVCTSKNCVVQAANLLSTIDDSIDPCEDFYGYVNNGWNKANPIPEDKATYGTLASIDQANKKLLFSIIESTDESYHNDSKVDRSNLKHIQSYFHACRNETLLDERGNAPLLDLVRQMLKFWRNDENTVTAAGPWDFMPNPPIFQGWLPNPDPEAHHSWPDATRSRRLTDALLFLHSNGIPALWASYIEADVRNNPNELKLWSQQGGLGLPDRQYYLDKDTTILKFYQKTVERTLKAVYGDLRQENAEKHKKHDKEFAKMAEHIVTFETRLAEISWDVVDLDNPLLTYNPFSIKQLSKLTGDIVNWRDYFSGFFPRPEFPDPLIVATPSYFKKLSGVVDANPDAVLEAYFVWRAALNFGKLLGPSSAIRKEVSKLSSYLRGIPLDATPDRAEVCMQSVQDSLGFLIGHFYVDEAFRGRSQEYASEIIADVINAFHDRLPELDWLDEKTRERAQKKASAIRRKIGFPSAPNTTDPVALARYYMLQAPFNVSDHFGNVLRAEKADLIRSFQKIGKAPNHGEWDMIPSEVNAYYQPSANEIVFPSGILQSPIFSVDRPDYLNAGAFGAVAGHELTHAFDKAGRLYDENGKLTNWWSNETNARFEKLQDCVVQKYAKYYVTDSNGRKYYINSRYTVGEDAADAGGLSQSFKAWRDRFERDRSGAKYDNRLLPGLNYTREQMFFIAYARTWAGQSKPQEAVRRILTDPHSPPNFRALGALSSSDDFATAFQCKVGTVYNPKDKCRLW